MMDDVAARMKELILTEDTREERLKRHCVLTVQALLHRSEPLKDVCFKCSDNEQPYAHKCILGTQCQYVSDFTLIMSETIVNQRYQSISWFCGVSNR